MLFNDLWLSFKTLWSRFKRQSNLLEQDALVANEDWQHILEVEMRDHIKRITTIPPNIDVEN